jgi:hypothetical protein
MAVDVAWLTYALTGAGQIKYADIAKVTHLMHVEGGSVALCAAERFF